MLVRSGLAVIFLLNHKLFQLSHPILPLTVSHQALIEATSSLRSEKRSPASWSERLRNLSASGTVASRGSFIASPGRHHSECYQNSYCFPYFPHFPKLFSGGVPQPPVDYATVWSFAADNTLVVYDETFDIAVCPTWLSFAAQHPRKMYSTSTASEQRTTESRPQLKKLCMRLIRYFLERLFDFLSELPLNAPGH